LIYLFLVLPLSSSPTAHELFSSPVTPSSGARRNLFVNFGSSPPSQNPQPVTLSPTTRQAAAKNAPACKYTILQINAIDWFFVVANGTVVLAVAGILTTSYMYGDIFTGNCVMLLFMCLPILGNINFLLCRA